MRKTMAGFSLIEMMIAMVLGLIVLGAAIAVFQSNQRTYSANQGLNRIQENARVAYEMLSRDIRSVGSSACSNEGLVLGTDATSLKFRAPITGTASELTVTSADDLSYRVKTATASSVTLTETTPAASDIFKVNDSVMVCNGSMTGFVTVASIAGQVVNFTSALEFDPTDTTNAALGSISIARARSTRWYVASNLRGGNSLWVSRFGAAGEEVADGVESMALTYHQYSGGNSAIYVASPSDFNYVDAVRMVLQLKGKDVDNRALTRTASTTIKIRSRPQ
ncbi:prepilin-type N-terminal cleavage/methylation domain-containing protein [Thermomonas sp.]|uniref:PilW family protein n=1 Tax=Thermomonas sp. TaxID=1971895 RepID=UPI002488B5D0|nr:prepilin-type N-terminal cleavage/methylation domain-containing protein [Thermomonas sp.]MDI1252036.1 prepilin-type N-terminal cleavage/methylation domain-containing protein [Thermomonas sp.]